jgi:hypothetical protein
VIYGGDIYLLSVLLYPLHSALINRCTTMEGYIVAKGKRSGSSIGVMNLISA